MSNIYKNIAKIIQIILFRKEKVVTLHSIKMVNMRV